MNRRHTTCMTTMSSSPPPHKPSTPPLQPVDRVLAPVSNLSGTATINLTGNAVCNLDGSAARTLINLKPENDALDYVTPANYSRRKHNALPIHTHIENYYAVLSDTVQTLDPTSF